MRAAQVAEQYVGILRAFVRSRRKDFSGEPWEAWARAYRNADLGRQRLEPLEAEQLLLGWQEELRKEMERVCSRVRKPDLLFALRLLDPGKLAAIGVQEPARMDWHVAMGVRRVAAHAALLYGCRTSEDYDAPYGGTVHPSERDRFAEVFLKLIFLSSGYVFATAHRGLVAARSELIVAPDGLDVPQNKVTQEIVSLIQSLDERKNAYYSPFSRIGEFSARAMPTREPDGMSLTSTRYEVSDSGKWSYGWVAWGLDPLREFVVALDSDLCRRAWGMTGIEFASLLAGLCHLITIGLTERGRAQALSLSSVVPLTRTVVEGEALLRHTAGYLRTAGFDPADFDLAAAREHFLWLAGSNNKENVEERTLKIQLGDTRHSYLLHRFGRFYAADLFHADHWLHRPLDLLANKMEGEQSLAKGKRFEGRLWEYLESLGTLRPVPELRGRAIYRTARSAGDAANDLDCAFALGRVLILIEAKAQLLRYPAEAMYHNAVQHRWEESKRYLEKIEDTARLLAAQRSRPSFQRGMDGIAYILPLVCRPYPEWVHSLDGAYWLRKPNRAVGDSGVPRVLTPGELRDFFASMDEERLIATASTHLAQVSDIPEQ